MFWQILVGVCGPQPGERAGLCAEKEGGHPPRQSEEGAEGWGARWEWGLHAEQGDAVEDPQLDGV